MHVIHKKVAILLISLAAVAFMVIILVYDQLPQPIQNLNPIQRFTQKKSPTDLKSQTDAQLLDSITEDFAILNNEYDFDSELSADNVDVPDLTGDLEITIE